MFVSADIEKVRKRIALAKTKANKVGFVPTMGALHKGHLSLVKTARSQCDFLAVSIFVNPIQFAPGEDLKCYPRNFKKDAQLLKKEGVDLVFHPSAKTVYPDNFSSLVREENLSNYLCGRSRRSHFQGVCTVVSKLFNIIQPDVVYFGQKDYQQAKIIQRLIQDLNWPIKIKILPIIRDKNGLALSSRNRYLTSKEGSDALIVYQALKLAKQRLKEGSPAPGEVTRAMKRLISSVKSAKIDYLEIVDAESLKKVKKIKGKILIALAVYIGKTRLIDNIIVNVK